MYSNRNRTKLILFKQLALATGLCFFIFHLTHFLCSFAADFFDNTLHKPFFYNAL